MFYKIARGVCIIVLHLLFRVKVEGKEHIPCKKGYILVANHRTNFDPLFVVAGLRQQVHFMAKAELFRGWFMEHLMNALGAFPVDRGKGDSGAIDWSDNLIRQGRVLGMFPEGTRSPDGKPQRPKSGAALIAMRTQADVLPCAVCFGEKLTFRAPVTVRYGAPIAFEQLGFTPGINSPREIKNASHQMMGEVIRLLEVGV